MEISDGCHQGRFSRAAAEARSKTPTGVSSREGWFIVAFAVVGALVVPVVSKAPLSEWLGIIRFAAQAVLIVLAILSTTRIVSARGTRPRGFRTRHFADGALAVSLALVCGWFWIVPDSHGTPWHIVTLITVLCILPLAVVGLQLVKAGEK